MSRARLLLATMAAMEPRILGYLPEPKPPRIYTDADQERREKAEAKRQRKAAKRAKATTPQSQEARDGN